MKMIVAIIRPEKLEEVQEALNERDVYLMTVSEVRGCGRQRGYAEMYRGTEYKTRLLPKLKIEIAVNDAFVDKAADYLDHRVCLPDVRQELITQALTLRSPAHESGNIEKFDSSRHYDFCFHQTG